EPEDLAPSLRPLQECGLTAPEPRQYAGFEAGLDPGDRRERRPVQIAVLGIGEGCEDRVPRLPTLEPPGQLEGVRGTEDFADIQAGRCEHASPFGSDPVAGEHEQATPALDELAQALRVRGTQALDVRQDDRRGLVQIGQTAAADEIDRCDIEWRSG